MCNRNGPLICAGVEGPIENCTASSNEFCVLTCMALNFLVVIKRSQQIAD